MHLNFPVSGSALFSKKYGPICFSNAFTLRLFYGWLDIIPHIIYIYYRNNPNEATNNGVIIKKIDLAMIRIVSRY